MKDRAHYLALAERSISWHPVTEDGIGQPLPETEHPWQVWMQRGCMIEIRDMRLEESRVRAMEAEKEKARREWEKHPPAQPFLYNGTPSRYASGRFKYVTHGLDDQRDVPCVEDYADKAGRDGWKNYVQIKDEHGNVIREGPRPFTSQRERKEYENLTGLSHRDRGQKDHRGRADIELGAK